MVRWALLEGDLLASLTHYSLSLMLFRIFTAASIVLGAMAPVAVEAASSCGYASHCGVSDGYHGQRAADGSRFDAHGLTAAHPWLPFGTRLRVTNQRNGRSVTIRITDRGPYYGGRILDLSYGAFARIAHPDNGEVRVCFARV